MLGAAALVAEVNSSGAVIMGALVQLLGLKTTSTTVMDGTAATFVLDVALRWKEEEEGGRRERSETENLYLFFLRFLPV